MKRHMARAWELAQGNAARGHVRNACVIIDPATGGCLLSRLATQVWLAISVAGLQSCRAGTHLGDQLGECTYKAAREGPEPQLFAWRLVLCLPASHPRSLRATC